MTESGNQITRPPVLFGLESTLRTRRNLNRVCLHCSTSALHSRNHTSQSDEFTYARRILFLMPDYQKSGCVPLYNAGQSKMLVSRITEISGPGCRSLKGLGSAEIRNLLLRYSRASFILSAIVIIRFMYPKYAHGIFYSALQCCPPMF